MTGSGKTYTMLGDIYSGNTGERGLCSMALDYLFAQIDRTNTKVKISYLEIYNEHVKDLLAETASKTAQFGLMILEDPIKGIVIPELTEYKINSLEEFGVLLSKGNEKRTMAPTRVNQFSSRSHAILQIIVESIDEAQRIIVGKLCMVDLAGSERAATSENKGIRMIEGGKINRSLLALGNCINVLSDKLQSRTLYVPDRKSVV